MADSFAAQLADALGACWPAIARPNQLPPPGDWQVWLLLAGRGFGKTRTLAEWVCQQAASGRAGRIALVAATAADARDVLVEGQSGILAVSPPWFRPVYEPSKRRLTWPNGAMATTFSAEEPERLRGPQHDSAICDELGSWSRPETWDMLQFGLRLGRHPRCLVATTPRPTRLIRELLAREGRDVMVTRGSTYENRANLALGFFDQIIGKYEGTRLGRQELNAELLEDTPGALWSHSIIDATRQTLAPHLARIVVAIDPAATSGEDADETGIVVVGKDHQGRGYVLADASGKHQPVEWAKTAVAAYRAHHADRIVAERNNGGAMVEATIRMVDGNVPVTTVWASRGKAARAEPVSARRVRRSRSTAATQSHGHASALHCASAGSTRAHWLEGERALSLSPDLASGHATLGGALVFSGRPGEGIIALETSIKLDPYAPMLPNRLTLLAVGLYFAGQYEAGVEAAKRTIVSSADYPLAHRWLAAALGRLGRIAEAERALEKAVAIDLFDKYVRRRVPWHRPEDHAHMIEGLRKAGWRD